LYFPAGKIDGVFLWWDSGVLALLTGNSNGAEKQVKRSVFRY